MGLNLQYARHSLKSFARSPNFSRSKWLVGSAVGRTLAAELPGRADWLVPTLVQLELAKWLTREIGETKADQVIAFTQTCLVADLDTAIVLAAADLCLRQKLATADAIIYATARAYGADLLTCDRHFERLADVRFVPKRSNKDGKIVAPARRRRPPPSPGLSAAPGRACARLRIFAPRHRQPRSGGRSGRARQRSRPEARSRLV